MEAWQLLLDLLVLLTGCLLVGGIFARCGQSPLVGYLLAGMLLGAPGSFGVISSQQGIEVIAELGVSLLLFGLGLEFSWGELRTLGQRTILSGVLQVSLTLAFASGLAFVCGLDFRESIAVGAMISVSSTACVLRVLFERGELDSLHGRQSLAILLVQDAAVVPLGILVALLGSGTAEQSFLFHGGRLVLFTFALGLGLFVLIHVFARRMLGLFTLEKNRELSVLLVITAGLGSAWAAHAVGISPALGAFMAGMLLGSSPFATQMRSDVSTLQVVLLTLFFGSAGMLADPVWIISHGETVFAVTAIIVSVKFLLIWLVLRLMGQTIRVASATALALAQVGEFAFVLGGIALENGALSQSTHLVLVSSTIVSLLITPYLVSLAPSFGLAVSLRLSGAKRQDEETPDLTLPFRPRIVIIGFGPAGQIAAEQLKGKESRVLVIDLNRTARARAEALGFRGLIGDATHIEILKEARVADAEIALITVPHRLAADTILKHILNLAPQINTVVRARHHRDRKFFLNAGAKFVFDDEEEVGRKLAEQVLKLGNISPGDWGADDRA